MESVGGYAKAVFRRASLAAAVSTLVVVTAGCGRDRGKGGFSMPPMPVEVSAVTVQTVADKFEGVGTIEAIEAVTVVSEIDAIVEALPFEEGAFIRRGSLIAQLDDAQLAAEKARAEALLAQVRANYERVKTVVEQNAAAPQDLDDAEGGLKVAEANLAVANARLAKTRITAPFEGIIGARRVSVGTFLRTGGAIADLANIDEIRVTFSVPERNLFRVAQGAVVTVSTPALPGHEVDGEILVVEPLIDPSTRSARVTARVPNPDRKFRAGMSANVSAVLGERANAITIPNEAVFGSGDQLFVFVVGPDSTVSRVPLKLGTRLPDAVEVVEGLKPGMTVVRAGHQKLFDGGKVMPIGAHEGGKPAETADEGRRG